MYKIARVVIDGFWQKYTAETLFEENVNIIIGMNGTGKTTFMNILNAALSVDPIGLYENDFETVSITLVHEKSTRTIKVTKKNDFPFPSIAYQIARKVYGFPLLPPSDESRAGTFSRRRMIQDEVGKIKAELTSLVSLASLSVYRFRNSDIEGIDRPLSRKLGPVDARLEELMQELTKYQLELSMQAREISVSLQKEVLMSLLYKSESEPNQVGYALDFNAEQEKQNLTSAYKQLGVAGSSANKRIQDHITAVDSSVNTIKEYLRAEKEKETGKKTSDEVSVEHLDFAPLEANRRAHKVFTMSLEAEGKIEKVFSQINVFTEMLKDFIENKSFTFEAGKLVVNHDANTIAVPRLSSGEKQLLILFVEALLQRQKPFVFLADEPELSLHIEWQRKILPAIKKLNPNAQVIVATHSPEIAAAYSSSIIDMEDILHV